MRYQLLLCYVFFFPPPCQFVCGVSLNCSVSVCVSYCYGVALTVVTEKFPTVTFFWPVKIFISRGSSRYEKLF